MASIASLTETARDQNKDGLVAHGEGLAGIGRGATQVGGEGNVKRLGVVLCADGAQQTHLSSTRTATAHESHKIHPHSAAHTFVAGSGCSSGRMVCMAVLTELPVPALHVCEPSLGCALVPSRRRVCHILMAPPFYPY